MRIGYGLGSLCTGTFATVPGLILLYYLTDVLAVPAAVAGAAVFLPKAWDVLINPLVGAMSDRSRLRGGPDTWRCCSCWQRPRPGVHRRR